MRRSQMHSAHPQFVACGVVEESGVALVSAQQIGSEENVSSVPDKTDFKQSRSVSTIWLGII